MKPLLRIASPLLATILVLLVSACSNQHPPADPSYLAEINNWHAERVMNLQADDGWLSLVGLHWLASGENSLGSASDNNIIVPAGSAPEKAAVLILGEDDSIRIRSIDNDAMMINAERTSESLLSTDADGAPDIVEIGRLRFYVIKRGERFAVRIKDPEAPTRLNFHGIDRFPVDPVFKVESRPAVYQTPTSLAIATAIGTEEKVTAPGKLHFVIDGQELSLEPFADTPQDSFFIVFRDSTSGQDSYGAGRFLSADPPVDGKVLLDFNRAINPPCAFTPYATCPLAPSENQLNVPIRAGEKYSGPAHS